MLSKATKMLSRFLILEEEEEKAQLHEDLVVGVVTAYFSLDPVSNVHAILFPIFFFSCYYFFSSERLFTNIS